MMKGKMIEVFVHQFLIFVICLPYLSFSLETDIISSSSVIKDPDTIVSFRKVFKFGFYSPPNNTNRYLAVFYADSENTVIWIANRESPLNDSSSAATISEDGNLVLINSRNQTVWSTNLPTTSPMNTTLQILDTGNLVLRDNATGDTAWESFSHPSDVLVPTMKLIHNINTGEKVMVSSWKTETDPEVGNFTLGLEALNIPQSFIWNNGRPRWRSGPWNGSIFLGIPQMYLTFIAVSEVKNDSAGNFSYSEFDTNLMLMERLNSSGSVVRTVLSGNQRKRWDIIWESPETECDVYGTCGPFGSCNARDSPICSCLRGFEPVNTDEWQRGNWSSGCQRKTLLQCNNTSGGPGNRDDGFSKLKFMKVPDFAERFYSGQVDECRSRCLRNCSCIAYAHESNIGCMFWSDILIDIQKLNGVGPDLYVRLSASELAEDHKDKKAVIIIAVAVAFACISIFIFIVWCLMAKRKGIKMEDRNIFEAGQKFSSNSTTIVVKDESEKVFIGELPLFTFEMLANATNQFCENNLLGRGGFGDVYKGNLENGEEIAVKRLSAASGQGMKEFLNEVVVISKLQHRNLVKLLGYCVDKDEKMLIYEYMPNKSLDVCLFDPSHPSRNILDWMKRFSIIEGIGRGLLYLHKDSRLKIIHRDLKPSNVLLDENWNPKISDFGMARIFGGNEDHCDTARVVGTYGYMSPEYAMEGRFSEKSDVYSFGVLVLEIMKGKKNTHYYNHEWSLGLLGCAWKFWNEDNGFAFGDESIVSSNFQEEITRCIQIGLLCVQESPDDRPTIQTVLSMLSDEIVDLPAPKQPVFAEKWNNLTPGSTRPGPASQVGYSINELTLTVLDGR